MKINPVLAIIATVASLLIGYTFFHYSEQLYAAIGMALASLLTLNTTLSITIIEDSRISINLRIVSVIFFFMTLIMTITCVVLSASTAFYILTTTFLLLIWLLIIYGLSRSKK